MNDQDRVAAPTDAQDRGTRSPRPGAVFLLELGGDFRLLNANHQALGDFSHLTPPPPLSARANPRHLGQTCACVWSHQELGKSVTSPMANISHSFPCREVDPRCQAQSLSS